MRDEGKVESEKRGKMGKRDLFFSRLFSPATRAKPFAHSACSMSRLGPPAPAFLVPGLGPFLAVAGRLLTTSAAGAAADPDVAPRLRLGTAVDRRVVGREARARASPPARRQDRRIRAVRMREVIGSVSFFFPEGPNPLSSCTRPPRRPCACVCTCVCACTCACMCTRSLQQNYRLLSRPPPTHQPSLVRPFRTTRLGGPGPGSASNSLVTHPSLS